LVLDLKILVYPNADEIEKLKKIKEDSDREAVTALMQLKDLSESRDLMQQELVELRDVKDATQVVVGLVEIPEGNEDEPLMLAGRLRKIPESFKRYVSTTTRQYVGHALGLVKSYWPRTPMDVLREGAKAVCTDDQFGQYMRETSPIADKIVESLNKSGSP